MVCISALKITKIYIFFVSTVILPIISFNFHKSLFSLLSSRFKFVIIRIIRCQIIILLILINNPRIQNNSFRFVFIRGC